MKKMKNIVMALSTLLFLAGASSCIKDNFDEPKTGGTDPDITVNFRIDSLQNRFNGNNMLITDDLVISGIVTADDKSGNFYKNFVVQDESGAISVLVERSTIYTEFPIGRRVFIKLKGLYLGAYGGLIQLGGYLQTDGSMIGIPSPVVEQHILKGRWGLYVAPQDMTISQLNPNDIHLQNRLIRLNGVEFTTADAGKPYADASNKITINRVLKDCNGGSVELRNSGYSDFATQLTPNKNGSVVAIYSVYNGGSQLYIRNTGDVVMDSARCGGGLVSNDGIAGVRNLYSGADVVIPSGTMIRGVVISDVVHANTDTKNLVVQDSTTGIVLRFTATHSFNLGDSVLVNLAGYTLTSYNGLYEVTNMASSSVTVLATGVPVTPRVVTVAQANANAVLYQSTLLKIVGATITGSGTVYSGTRTITDLTGNLNLYTRSTATFSATTCPTGTVSITGIMSMFTTPQLTIRDVTDVQ